MVGKKEKKKSNTHSNEEKIISTELIDGRKNTVVTHEIQRQSLYIKKRAPSVKKCVDSGCAW